MYDRSKRIQRYIPKYFKIKKCKKCGGKVIKINDLNGDFIEACQEKDCRYVGHYHNGLAREESPTIYRYFCQMV